ncbi:MAG: TetR/AcrR family transcriptional regulator [Actinomycetota bacterium]
MGRKQDDVSDAVIQTACRLLSTEGAEALTTRRIAAEAGTTTMAIYTRFGGKEGVTAAVYVEGFLKMERALSRAMKGNSDPVSTIVAGALAYRRFGLRHASYYGVMFHRTVQGFEPDEECRRIALRSLDLLGLQVQRAIGDSRADLDVTSVTLAVWALCHGATSIELDQAMTMVSDPEADLEDAIRALLRGFSIGTA